MSKRNWWQRILKALAGLWGHKTTGGGSLPVPPEIAPPAPSGTAWPAYLAPAWNAHRGDQNETENEYRETAIRACRAQGLDCLRIVAGEPFRDFGLSMHMLKISDPERNGHRHPGSWYLRATAAGVKRWVWDVRGTRDVAGWARLAGDYGTDELQWVLRPGQDATGLDRWGVVREA